MKEPEWIAIQVILAIHEAQLAEHGGADGIRDRALLESALARPKNLYAYSENLSLNQLAAALAVGIVKSHAFLDGNKRTAWVACALFLELNGIRVVSESTDVVGAMLAAAEGRLTEEEFALWLDKDHPPSPLL